jgi:hypothetical protein
MEVLKGVDTVELKLTVPAAAQRATIQGLPLDPVEAQPRQVFFFDTPDLALDAAGVVVRARRIQGGRGDTVVKIRPVEPSALPTALRAATGFNVEVDVVPGGFVCSGSYKGRSSGDEIRKAVRGSLPVRKLFSKEQRAFYRQHAPEGVELDLVRPLGPTYVLKARFPFEASLDRTGAPRTMVGEVWLYPDGSRILELSTKCLANEAFQVAAEARAYLTGVGVPLGGAQQMKTKTALEFFQAELAAGQDDERGAGDGPEAPARRGAGRPRPGPGRCRASRSD